MPPRAFWRAEPIPESDFPLSLPVLKAGVTFFIFFFLTHELYEGSITYRPPPPRE